MYGHGNRGITLVALIITIIVLVILVGVSIGAMLNSGIIKNTETATTGYSKEEATEKMNLKITNIQMETYAQQQTMPTLQILADSLCEDDEMQYVQLTSEKTASLTPIKVGEATSIYTKLKAYPYEFEIDSSLRLASIDGIKVANTDNNGDATGITSINANSVLLKSTNSSLNVEEVNLTSFTNEFNESTFATYFSYNETTGELTCKQDGWYLINLGIDLHRYTSNWARTDVNGYVNNVGVSKIRAIVEGATSQTDCNDTSATLFLKKGDVLTFDKKTIESNVVGRNDVTISIIKL